MNLVKSFTLTIILGLICCSCKTGPDSINKDFEEKFSREVAKIQAQRTKEQTQFQDQKLAAPQQRSKNGGFDNPNEILGISTPYNATQADFDTEILRHGEAPQQFTPNAATFNQGAPSLEANRLPPDIFELHYNTRQHPPFAMRGIEFDGIRIPEKDAYGVASNLSDKQYRLAGNDSYQRSLDKLIKNQNSQDLEFSKILIKEQKEIYRQARINEILGNNIKPKEEPKTDDSWLKERKKMREDPVRKVVAQQVIQRNLDSNRPTSEEKKQNQKKKK